MYWFVFLVLPLLAAWKKRSANLAEEVFALYSAMLAAFLSVWCEPLVRSSITVLLPPNKSIMPWVSMGIIFLIWFITAVVFSKIIETAAPEGLSQIIFPEKISKLLVPLIVFLRTGLILALIFTALSVSPVKTYFPIVTDSTSLCTATRYHILWNSFFIDRFSNQPVTVTLRRRAFDRFIPEFPNVPEKKGKEKEKGR